MDVNVCPPQGRRECADAAATQALGRLIGASLQEGDLVILVGPLGAGKTTLTQGIADGMRVRGRVTSPTFTIARVHRALGNGPDLIHVDAYRLCGQGGADADPWGAIDALDLESEIEDSVIVAEWGRGVVEPLSLSRLVVTVDRTSAVEHDPDSQVRYISWEYERDTDDSVEPARWHEPTPPR